MHLHKTPYAKKCKKFVVNFFGSLNIVIAPVNIMASTTTANAIFTIIVVVYTVGAKIPLHFTFERDFCSHCVYHHYYGEDGVGSRG